MSNFSISQIALAIALHPRNPDAAVAGIREDEDKFIRETFGEKAPGGDLFSGQRDLLETAARLAFNAGVLAASRRITEAQR